MVFIVGISLGVAALSLRSPSALALIGVLIAGVFTLAAIFSASGVPFLSLLVALGGYNLGIASGFGAMLAMSRLKLV